MSSNNKFKTIEVNTVDASTFGAGEQFILTKSRIQDNQNTRDEGGYIRSIPRAQLGKVFALKGKKQVTGISLRGRYVEFSNGVQDHTIPQEYFTTLVNGQLSIGCKTFDVETTKIIRKWAKAAVKTSSVTKSVKKSSRRAA